MNKGINLGTNSNFQLFTFDHFLQAFIRSFLHRFPKQHYHLAGEEEEEQQQKMKEESRKIQVEILVERNHKQTFIIAFCT